MAAMPNLRAIVALGRVAHDSMLKVLELRAAAAPFSHGAIHPAGALKLYDSYHCSRYNTNTRVLTPEMFRSVLRSKSDLIVERALPHPAGVSLPRTLFFHPLARCSRISE